MIITKANLRDKTITTESSAGRLQQQLMEGLVTHNSNSIFKHQPLV